VALRFSLGEAILLATGVEATVPTDARSDAFFFPFPRKTIISTKRAERRMRTTKNPTRDNTVK
jgi:hypothetical protein